MSGLALARIEAHYFINAMFLADKPLLERLPAISHLPAAVVQGRYDVVCPITTAYELVQNWEKAVLYAVPDAGHSAMEAGTRGALVEAMERFKSILP